MYLHKIQFRERGQGQVIIPIIRCLWLFVVLAYLLCMKIELKYNKLSSIDLIAVEV